MRKLLLLTALFLCKCLWSQENIVIGTKHTIHSNELKEARNIQLFLPPDYHNDKFHPARYPVIYLLDGESNFHSFTGLVQGLMKGPYALVPQCIVVGIINTDRTRDLTPTPAPENSFFAKRNMRSGSGGGNAAFIQFLEKELRPYIDSTYRTSGYNMLVGHSFGGLTATNILLHHTVLFNSYIIIDPSLWWDDMLMLKKAAGLFTSKDFRQRNIYVAMAHKELMPQDTTTDHQRAIRTFGELLEKQQPVHLRYAFRFYGEEDHGTIPIPAAYDGLRFIFKGHQVQVKMAVDSPVMVERQFALLSQQTGFEFQPSESWLNWMGDFCAGRGKNEASLHYYLMAANRYPQSAGAQLNLGKACKRMGSLQQAATSFRKVLALQPGHREAAALLEAVSPQ